MMRWILGLIGVTLIMFSCSEDYQKMDQVLTTSEGSIVLWVKFVDREKSIVNSFYATFENNAKNKLVIFENGIIKDSDGIVLIDFSQHIPKLFGYKIQPSYPTNRLFLPGFNLETYFGSVEGVGDNFRIQWNGEKHTFEKPVIMIP